MIHWESLKLSVQTSMAPRLTLPPATCGGLKSLNTLGCNVNHVVRRVWLRNLLNLPASFPLFFLHIFKVRFFVSIFMLKRFAKCTGEGELKDFIALGIRLQGSRGRGKDEEG